MKRVLISLLLFLLVGYSQWLPQWYGRKVIIAADSVVWSCDMLPNANGLRNIGSPNLRFKSVYLDSLMFGYGKGSSIFMGSLNEDRDSLIYIACSSSSYPAIVIDQRGLGVEALGLMINSKREGMDISSATRTAGVFRCIADNYEYSALLAFSEGRSGGLYAQVENGIGIKSLATGSNSIPLLVRTNMSKNIGCFLYGNADTIVTIDTAGVICRSLKVGNAIVIADSIGFKVQFNSESMKRIYYPGLKTNWIVMLSLEGANTFVSLMDSLKTDSIIVRSSSSFSGFVNILVLRKP